MFKNILVPLDGSDLAEGIYPHVKAMAASFGACVTLLHVNETRSSAVVDPLSWQLQKAEAQAYLRDQAERLQKAGVPVESCLLEGPAAERIVEYADQQRADLIILSSHGQGGPSKWNVSHIAQKVLQRGTTSILLVPAARGSNGLADQLRYRRVLLPLDGSRRAECVLPAARILARQKQTDLLLVHVTVRPMIFSRMPDTDVESAASQWLINHNRDEADAYFEKLASRISSTVQIALPVSDNVALTLHQLVTDEAVDLVVFSAHGRTANSQWPYGSITGNFIDNGSVPLLIVQDLPQAVNKEPAVEYDRRTALHGVPDSTSYFGQPGIRA